MDHAVESGDLEERWQRMFNEFQDFRSERIGRKTAARDLLDARQQEIDAEILRIRNKKNEQIGAIERETNTKLRQIEEQTDIEIKRLRVEAHRKATEIEEARKKDIQSLQAQTAISARVLEDERASRKRKYEEDNREIEFEFSSRLEALDRRLRASALPDTPPPSATRETPVNALQVNDTSAHSSLPVNSLQANDILARPSLPVETQARPREEIPESPPATRTSLPPLRSRGPEPPPRTSLASDVQERGPKKHRFEGFAKDGCITCKRRARLCDCAKPVCGRCKADDRSCQWPQLTASQQPARDDPGENNRRCEAEDARAPSLRPSNTEDTVRANPDLLPAFSYDASRRPSQRVVRLSHSVDRVEPADRGQERVPELGNSSAEQPPVRSPSQDVSPSTPSLPSGQQSERSGQGFSSPTAQKTITYDEVFENVQRQGSREKHFIVQWPEKSNTWYILRCEKHDMNFGEYVFSSARSHLYSEAHGHVPRTKENAIRELGVLVLGCDAGRAQRSNAVYSQALRAGYKPNPGNIDRRKWKKKKHRSRARGGASKHVPTKSKSHSSTSGAPRLSRPSRAFEGITDPIPGEVYQGAQEELGRSDLRWYLVVCLPVDDWKTIGIDGTLRHSSLAKSMPPCYQRIFHWNSEPVALDWAPDFKTGGRRVKERQFPCLVLRPGLDIPPWGQNFSIPSGEQFLSWVCAAKLRPSSFKHPWNTLPSSTKGVENGHGVARKYLRRLEAYRASRGEPRLEVDSQEAQNEFAMDQDTAAADAQLTTRGESEEDMTIDEGEQENESDVEAHQENHDHDLTDDNIVVISLGHDESPSSLSPVPSEYDGNAVDLYDSSSSTSSDGQDASVDYTALAEDLDIGDYNDPPRAPSPTSQSGSDSEYGGPANEVVDANTCVGPYDTPSAVEALRAIQAELIPGYYGQGGGRDEEPTGAQERSDPLLLFPGLSTRSMLEEDSDQTE